LFHAGKDAISTVVFSKKLQVIFVGAGSRLLRVPLSGRAPEVLALCGGRIHQVVLDDFQSNMLMVAAEQGAYISHDFGKSFTKIFTAGSQEDEGYAEATTIAKIGQKTFVGTEEGLFAADNDVWIWHRVAEVPAQSSISWIQILPDGRTMLVASDYGMYKSADQGMSFKKVLVAHKVFSEEGTDEEQEVSRQRPLHIAYEPVSRNIYVATAAGMYISQDKGESFSRVSSSLDGNAVFFIYPLSAQVQYAATSNGVYVVDAARPSERLFSDGVPHQSSRAVVPLSKDEVFVATVQEIVRVNLSANDTNTGVTPAVLSRPSANAVAKQEPSLQDVRTAAIVYNEVGPEKIERWRKRAQARGFFPQVSVSYDTTVDIYQTTTTTRVVKGPLDWGVSFKWDLADFVWNPYQKDIDVRSRLNTQLRMEIISEITRLYFERKKLLAEVGLLQPNDSEYAQKQLRLEEVSAVLDGYTGGWLSRQLQ